MTTREKYQLLPDLPPEQYEALKADIAERGVMVPVDVDEFGAILDGHNRARACRELGINDYPVTVRPGLSEQEKRTFARKANVLRRHLTREQVRELIGDQLRDMPAMSNRQIAQAMGVDHKTVGAVRDGMQATGEIPQLEKLTGADGRQRAAKRRKPRQDRAPDAWEDDDLDDDDLDDDDDLAAEAVESPRALPPYTKEAKAWKRQERERRRDDKEWAAWGATPERRAKMEHASDLIQMGADPNGEKVTKLLREAAVSVIETPGYNPYAGRTEAEVLEWHLFIKFLSFDADAGRDGGEPKGVAAYVEWILQRPFQNVAEWLGEEGDKFRGKARRFPEQFKADWSAFLDAHRGWTLEDVVKAIEALQPRFEQARAEARLVSAGP